MRPSKLIHRVTFFLLLPALLHGTEGGKDKVAKSKKPAAAAKPEEKRDGASQAIADPQVSALLDKMDRAVYRLSREGVKRYSCRVKSQVTDESGKVVQTAQLLYHWDGSLKEPKGKLYFHEPGPNGETEMEARILDDMVHQPPWRSEYAGCRLTTLETGKKARIKVDGKHRLAVREISLNSDGLPEKLSVAAALDPQSGGLIGFDSGEIRYEYVSFDGKFLPSRITVLEGGEEKRIFRDDSYDYTRAGKYIVPREHSTVLNDIAGKKKYFLKETFTDPRFGETAEGPPSR